MDMNFRMNILDSADYAGLPFGRRLYAIALSGPAKKFALQHPEHAELFPDPDDILGQPELVIPLERPEQILDFEKELAIVRQTQAV
jgi:hypothetical protein